MFLLLLLLVALTQWHDALIWCTCIQCLTFLIDMQAWILWAWTVLGDAPRACTALLHCTSWFLLGALFLHWTKI